MSHLYLDWNLGLGDAIICNGLVRELAKHNDFIALPCKKHNLLSVRHMFSDLDNVRIFGEHPPTSMMNLSIGLNHPRWGTVEPFDRAFYEFAGVDFNCRWSSFHVPPTRYIPPRVGGDTLVFNWSSHGEHTLRDVNRAEVFWPSPDFTPTIFEWTAIISAADEIHCVDSAPLHLVESVPTRGKLFFHRYARPATINVHATLRKPWILLD